MAGDITRSAGSGTPATIPNHYSPRLSELDLRMVKAIPPGGNWKSIPLDIPSRRLSQIRRTFLSGNGSRSTYYGRLDPDMPAFTISTCINRPGNGCYIHYDWEGGQHRLISQREAARLQSFPDWFAFQGTRASVNRQIGNAVPPLLAHHVARKLGRPGVFVDLFCGAGGLSLGFKMAGWTPLIAVDLDPSAVATYGQNVHESVVAGSIEDDAVFEALLEKVGELRPSDQPMFVVGGPPCQGFSTAGNRRSTADPRNSLFRRFSMFIEEARPDGFVFENVPGILSMDRGRFFGVILHELSKHVAGVSHWQLAAVEFGVPQRRRRVFVVGRRNQSGKLSPPARVTRLPDGQSSLDGVARAISVREALSDLPPLVAGEDGSHLDYVHAPEGAYQELMRRGR
ncbi:MAG: DNA (cytosine-5-)-methyltransferase [Euryarchaeota archaeon]|nr:DNA (cytosine-5-)-methyltransferase [Euryarchaeota archaeon]MDE1836587.1 DNA (cytosine-5-)-methyltransferase [Euryarchaeota archaeon]MDE1879218.1 DNA (cytosine-5-)-methyltransferase [Euryarchaeota archaeon]MDE2044557.1 DNA (cytosine-5-)-methyltransferase [Thermoplasmata archaeon]